MKKNVRKMFTWITRLLFGIPVLLLIYAELFDTRFERWIYENLLLMFGSLVLLMFAIWLGIISIDDFENEVNEVNDRFIMLTIVQLIFSFCYKILTTQNSMSQSSGSIVFIILLMPTIIFIANTFFRRVIRIDNMLKDFKNNDENKGQGIEVNSIKSYKRSQQRQIIH